MSQQIRLLLKAVALGRYLLTNHRLSKLSATTVDAVKGTTSITEVAKVVFPVSKEQLHKKLRVERLRKRLKYYMAGLGLVGFVSYEYYSHQSFVPITNRKHFVVIPRQVELNYQDAMVESMTTKLEGDGLKVLGEDDSRVQYIEQILRPLIDSCIYFSPECEEYMRNLKVIVVEDDTVNAYTTMGSVLVVYTGLIDHYKNLKKDGSIQDVDECMAGVLAHELAHALSRHPVESMLRWTGWAYYIYITLVPDFVFVPLLKGIFDKRFSRSQEFEADFEALYILKRSGYDPSSFIKTLSLLPEEEDDIELLSIAKESMDDHPRIVNRVANLQDRIFWFERDFKQRYQIVEKEEDDDSYFSSFFRAIGFSM